MKNYRDKKYITNVIILVCTSIAIFIFFWIATYFGTGESAKSEKPLVVCQPQNAPPAQQKCFLTAHIHANVRVFKGGKQVSVGFEQGILEKIHTHAEIDKIHWHGLIPVNPRTKIVDDWSILAVGNFPKDLGLEVDSPKFVVNGNEVDYSFVWKDGDDIEIFYE